METNRGSTEPQFAPARTGENFIAGNAEIFISLSSMIIKRAPFDLASMP
jgi:hypothetical protein